MSCNKVLLKNSKLKKKVAKKLFNKKKLKYNVHTVQ